METKGKSSLICLAVSHLIGQSLVVVKECLVRLPTTALLLWGNLSRDQLLQKACYAIKTFLTLKKLWHPKHFCVTFMYPKKTNQKNEQIKLQAKKKGVDKNKRERCSYYGCFNLRNVLLWFCIYSYTEKKCQELFAWVSCRTFCYKGLLSVIVLVAKTHFLHKRRWTNRSMSPKKGWCSEVLPMTAMKRWPYWRFHRTVKKTENTLQAKRVVVRYRVYQTVDIAVTKEKLDLLLPKV